MASHDPDELWPKLDRLGLDEVRKRRAQDVYGQRKQPVVDEWIEREEEKQNAPTYMYYPVDAPDGKKFSAHEAQRLEKQGWYDSPAKFPSVRQSVLVDFWTNHWKWIIGTALALAWLFLEIGDR